MERDLIHEDEQKAIGHVIDHAFDDGSPPMRTGTDDLVYEDEIAECNAVWMGKKPWKKPDADTVPAADHDHDLER
ncbi:hypothetical protein HF289_08640 [Acidithiobacillus ferrooxidans]|uniref:hypothetical protein n=1 Tax=Acidithiobacillus ferrooxidans TaxID=920 RepID=UPI001C0684D4|nr:hypothetical protein [Acidithiobacillus ferrooxidans]MBU2856937.1 hypothetical protein [Acidithiobacillus ferrooxidans]